MIIILVSFDEHAENGCKNLKPASENAEPGLRPDFWRIRENTHGEFTAVNET